MKLYNSIAKNIRPCIEKDKAFIVYPYIDQNTIPAAKFTMTGKITNKICL